MSKELGTLVIVILKGQHLIDNHTFYKQDPYVKLSLSGATKQTPVDPKGGQHPVWDAELRFPISRDPSKSNRTLTISVFSEEKKEDELLGEATVDITDTLKSGEFDDWVPLSLKGTQRGDVFLEMTFFAAGPAPLNRRPSKFTNPAERLARPQQQQPVAQRPQRLVSQPQPSSLGPGGQAQQRPNTNEGSRQGRSKTQQVPLPGRWPGPSAQQRQSTQPSAPSLHNRRTSKGEELPPLPPDATPPKEEFVPSILRPGGPSRTGVGRAPSPPTANGAAVHRNTMPNDSGANTAYPPRHHTVNQTMPPFPGSPVPQAHIHSSPPQPQSQPQPPAPPHSPHLPSYPAQGTVEHVGYSQGGHATTQPFPQAQPEVSHTQYHSQTHPPPQPHQQVQQHSPWQQPQPQGGSPGRNGSPYPTDNHPAQPYVPAPGPPSPGQSYFASSSPKPPSQPYLSSQIASPPVPSHISAQSPPPVPGAWPYAPNTSPVPYARPHSTSPSPGIPAPPTHQYATTPGPVPPTQSYAPTPPPSAPPYTAPTNSVPLGQPYGPPTILSPPPQSATPSPHLPPYIPTSNPAFSFPTSPPPMPPHSPTYAPPHVPSFPVPSFPVPQSSGYFEPVPPAPFSPPPEPELPDPYLHRRYQSPLPLPPGAPRPLRASPDARSEPPTVPPSAAASSSTQRGGGVRRENEDERAARELQRWEEESARVRREQEERDAELARTLDLELNMNEPGHPSHSQLPPLSTGVVRNASVGEW